MTIRAFATVLRPSAGAFAKVVVPAPQIKAAAPQSSTSYAKPTARIQAVQAVSSIDFVNALLGDLQHVSLVLNAFLDPDSLNRYLRGDAVNIVDSASLSSAKTLLSEAAVLDVAAIAAGLSRSEGLSVTESISVATTFVRQFTDSFGVSDINTLDVDKVLQDTAVATEQLIAAVDKALIDTAQVTEVRAISVSRPLFDAFATQDVLERAVAYSRAYNDTLSTADSAPLLESSLAKSDTVSASEQLAINSQSDKTDTVQTADSTALSVALPATNTVSVNDILARTVAYVRTLFDTVGIDDNATIGGVEKQTQADKTNVVSIAEEQQFAVFKSAVDQASLSDALSALFERSVSDGVSLTEEIVIVNRSLASSVLNNSALNTSAFNI